MAEMSDDDYNLLDNFVRTVLQRVSDSKSSVDEGVAYIMHPLTAWDRGNTTEFIPWIKQWLANKGSA